MRDGDAVREQTGNQPAGPAAGQDFLGHHDNVEQVAAATSHLFGVAQTEQSEVASALVQTAGEFTRGLPIAQPGGDLRFCEGSDQGRQGPPLLVVELVHRASSSKLRSDHRCVRWSFVGYWSRLPNPLH
jgi:hypothetical protein